MLFYVTGYVMLCYMLSYRLCHAMLKILKFYVRNYKIQDKGIDNSRPKILQTQWRLYLKYWKFHCYFWIWGIAISEFEAFWFCILLVLVMQNIFKQIAYSYISIWDITQTPFNNYALNKNDKKKKHIYVYIYMYICIYIFKQ